jgi:hypothetical protein
MKQVRNAALSALLALAGAQAMAFGPIMVTEPGADGFNIETMAFNGSSYDITQLTFDFTGTTTTDASNIVIDGLPMSITAPAGGTATFFGSGAVFGFNFTSFNTFDTFKFKWDPDSAINGSYGATGLDFIGATVTAVTTNGTYSGKFVKVGATPDVSAVLSPVPEAESFALALAGLAVVGGVAARRSRKA